MSIAKPVPRERAQHAKFAMSEVVRRNSLSLAMFGFFALFLAGQSIAGWHAFNEEARQHGEQVAGYLSYLGTGHFWEAVFENWESEFLQMAAYVILTAFLIQKGSAESKKPPEEGENPQDKDPAPAASHPDAPGPVKRGGWLLRLYEHSLSLALVALFLFSFAGHAFEGARDYNWERVSHGEPRATILQYMGSSQFWFESLQNWQSEFLAVFALVILSIWLRQRGSPESKPVAAPHSETGAG